MTWLFEIVGPEQREEQREEKQEYFGTVVFRLYDEVVPIMVQNFQELCTGQNGFGYERSLIRRVILSFKEAVFRTHTSSDSSSESEVSTWPHMRLETRGFLHIHHHPTC